MNAKAALLVAISMISFVACGGDPKPLNEGQPKVLAKVNGAPITDSDLGQRSRKAGMGGGAVHESMTGNVLKTLVRDELIYQEAVRLGLDKEPEYRAKLGELEAQLRAFQREEMASRFRRYVKEKASVTDVEARRYFDENAELIRTRFQVLQIFYKGDHPEIGKALDDLKAGMAFEAVAARRFPALPPGVKPPWDVGELHWFQFPDAWKGIVDRLEPGQVTDLIKGENERIWVVKLVSRTVDPTVTFETEKGRIVEKLRQRSVDALYDGMLAELDRKASVVYSK